jgi:hypothetical protein
MIYRAGFKFHTAGLSQSAIHYIVRQNLNWRLRRAGCDIHPAKFTHSFQNKSGQIRLLLNLCR